MDDEDRPAGIRRLCIAVDLERYSALDGDGQYDAQERLAAALTLAWEATGLPRTASLQQPQGDGEMRILAPGMNEREVIRSFVHGLHDAVERLPGAEALRARVAVHEGVVRLAKMGFSGRAVVTTARLLDSPPVRQALRDNPDVRLAMILSEAIYEDHVGQADDDFSADSFRQVQVELPTKGFRTYAWLWLPSGGEIGIPAAQDAGRSGRQTSTGRDTNRVGGDQYRAEHDLTITHGDSYHADRDMFFDRRKR